MACLPGGGQDNRSLELHHFKKYRFPLQNSMALSNFLIRTLPGSSIDNSSKFARCCTDVTACVVPADPQASRPARIYVYFVDEMNHLYRAYADVAKDLSFTDVDQRPKQVFQGKLEGDCQLSVFSYPAEGKNLVYAIKQGSEDYKISEIEDVFVEA